MEAKYFQFSEINSETFTLPQEQSAQRRNNKISTMRNSWLTFLPYNLLKQVLMPANIYFILIGVLEILPATSYTNGVPTIYGPLAVMILINIIKDALEEYARYSSDQEENNRKATRFDGKQFVECKWQDIVLGDILLVRNGENIPCDVLLLSTSEEGGIAYVETKQIDGESNLKQKYSLSELHSKYSVNNCQNYVRFCNTKVQSTFKVKFSYDSKNPILYKLSGHFRLDDSENQPIVYQNFIERDCHLKNTHSAVCVCVYAGMDCKIMLNSARERLKWSRLETSMRYCVITISIGLFVCCLIAAIYELYWTKNHMQYTYLGLEPERVFIDLGLWFSLLSYFIPISLVTNVELVKYGQGKMLECDQVMPNSKAHQSNLIEQLGEINFAFTDKTGTLTKNKMQFRELFSHNVQECLLAMSLCHSVIKLENTFIGSSPDEIAMLDYCELMSVRFQGIDNKQVMTVNGIAFTRLLCFGFDSEKKRMTVVVKAGQEYVAYCKGADEVLFDLMGTSKYKAQTKQFAVQGYRTLVFGKRIISEQEMLELVRDFKEADKLKDQDRIDMIQKKVEKDLEFLGITAVEDLLADDVASVIEQLKDAQIKTWVLTGDKVETAISIGYACNLLSPQEQVQIVHECTPDCIEKVFLQYNDCQSISLVISGQALAMMLDNPQLKQALLKKAMAANVVIVARVSPKQKQQVVQLVKEFRPNAKTLAIGDGANDVSMITEAHVGVGIQGVEGTQAARAADFAIPEFKHLRRLMFYYGVECSRRNALTILYIFYKNQVFITPYFWFGLVNGFSGQYLYDQWLSQLFNTVFASLPQILYALFDEIEPSSDYFELKKTTSNPIERSTNLYIQYRRSPLFTKKSFWIWILNGMIHGCLVLWFCLLCMENSPQDAGRTVNFFESGVLVYAATVLLVNLKIFTFTYTNYNFTIFFIALSVGLYWVCLWLLNEQIDSESYNFYRYLSSASIYLSLILVCQLFLVDLAIERRHDFLKVQRVIKDNEESIEMV